MILLSSNIIQDLIIRTIHHLFFRDWSSIKVIIYEEEDFIMEDKKILCKDCGNEFVFTVGEQEFYKEKGFDNEPVRCPDCRRARKQQRNNR